MKQMYVDSLVEYEQLKDEIAGKVENQGLRYFMSWWENAKMWASSHNRDVANLGVKTTNHIESYHQKIKKYVHAQLSLVDAVNQLLAFDTQSIRNMQDEKLISSCSRSYNVCFHDEEDREIASVLSGFAQDLVRKQAVLASKTGYTAIQEGQQDGMFLVAYDDKAPYRTSVTKCDCAFWRAFGLPCRHILFVRRISNLSLLDESSINPRFVKKKGQLPQLLHEIHLEAENYQQAPTIRKYSTPEMKYKKCKDIMSSMSAYLCLCGESDFISKCRMLENLLDEWKKGKKVIPVVSLHVEYVVADLREGPWG
jgi:hypothetical protein